MMFGLLRRILGIPQKIEIVINVPAIQITMQQPQARTDTGALAGPEHRPGIANQQSEHRFLAISPASSNEEGDDPELRAKFNNIKSAVGKFGQDAHK